MRQRFAEMRKEEPGLLLGEAMTRIGEEWGRLSEAQRIKYLPVS